MDKYWLCYTCCEADFSVDVRSNIVISADSSGEAMSVAREIEDGVVRANGHCPVYCDADEDDILPELGFELLSFYISKDNGEDEEIGKEEFVRKLKEKYAAYLQKHRKLTFEVVAFFVQGDF